MVIVRAIRNLVGVPVWCAGALIFIVAYCLMGVATRICDPQTGRAITIGFHRGFMREAARIGSH